MATKLATRRVFSAMSPMAVVEAGTCSVRSGMINSDVWSGVMRRFGLP